jgi:hypothetical protein
LRIEDREWKMAILDPRFSILDLANAHTSPLSLFEQPENSLGRKFTGRTRRLTKR